MRACICIERYNVRTFRRGMCASLRAVEGFLISALVNLSLQSVRQRRASCAPLTVSACFFFRLLGRRLPPTTIRPPSTTSETACSACASFIYRVPASICCCALLQHVRCIASRCIAPPSRFLTFAAAVASANPRGINETRSSFLSRLESRSSARARARACIAIAIVSRLSRLREKRAQRSRQVCAR